MRSSWGTTLRRCLEFRARNTQTAVSRFSTQVTGKRLFNYGHLRSRMHQFRGLLAMALQLLVSAIIAYIMLYH